MVSLQENSKTLKLPDMKVYNLWLLLTFLIITGCKNERSESSNRLGSAQIFQLLESEKTGIDFVNEVVDGENFNILTYRNFYNGGGVAIGDINNDSLPDLYFTANQKRTGFTLIKETLFSRTLRKKQE